MQFGLQLCLSGYAAEWLSIRPKNNDKHNSA